MLPPIAMTSLASVVRQVDEECHNTLDSKPNVTSITEQVFEGSQQIAVISCRRSKTGKVSISIRMTPQAPSTEANNKPQDF